MNDESTSLEKNNSQEGLEKVVGSISTYILRVNGKMSDILYGAYLLQSDKKANKIKKALDRGLINLLRELSAIDLCNIFTYLSNSKLGKSFNPKDPAPQVTDPLLKKIKYSVQMEAYKTQARIDKYYAEYGTLLGSDSRVGLQELVGAVTLSLGSLVTGRLGLTNPILRKEFPEVDLISDYLGDKLSELSASVTPNIQLLDVQKILTNIDKIRSYCVAIQALNNPAQVISAIGSQGIQDQLTELNKIVNPDKIVPLLYDVIKTCNSVNTTSRTILKYVSKGRVLVKLAMLLIRAFNAIMAFFIALPTFPVPAGAGVAFSNTFQNQLKERGEKKLLKVLKQVSNVLDEIYKLVSSIIVALTDIITILNIIILNLKSCNGNDDIVAALEQSKKESEDTRTALQDFIDQVDRKTNAAENTYGEYTIEIIREELADEGISIRRRYGIARGSDGIIAVQSTPTFASLDLIIINEVKLLLEAKGLIKTTSALTAEDSLLVEYASKYLEDNDIDAAITITQEGAATDKTDLQSFMNNLPGGKALRNRIRQQLLTNSAKLGSDLKSSDPNGKYNNSITPGG